MQQPLVRPPRQPVRVRQQQEEEEEEEERQRVVQVWEVLSAAVVLQLQVL